MKSSLKYCSLLPIIQLSVALAGQPLSSVYSIGTEGDFASFSEAVDSLALYGVSGEVTLLVAEGAYEEQVTIPPVPGTSASNRITFMADPANTSEALLRYSATTDTANWVVRLDTASYITFQDLHIQALGNAYARVLLLEDNSDHVHLINNRIIGNSANDDSHAYTLIYANTGSEEENPDSIVIQGNTFLNGSWAIYLNGLRADKTTGTRIDGNHFSNQYWKGIQLEDHTAPVVTNNIIEGLAAASSYYEGIYFYYCSNSIVVASNYITAYHARTGIEVNDCSASGDDPIQVVNNVVAIGGEGYAYGVYLNSSDNVQMVHNTVHITSTHETRGQPLKVSYGSGLIVKNNLFLNTGGGYGCYISTPMAVSAMDFNCFYTPGTFMGYWDAKQHNFNDFLTASGMDIHSVFINPAFVSETDLRPRAVLLNNLGIPLAEVDTTIDGVVRDAVTPDIGAYEFTAPGTPLAGEYTVGATGEYTTLDEALDSLVVHGISGPVTFNIAEGTYTGPWVITPIAGTSMANTVTFQSVTGNAADVTLTHAATSDEDNYVVQIYGADYLTLQSLTLEATGSSKARVIQLKGGPDHVSILDNILIGKDVSSTDSDYALVWFNSALGNHFKFSGNTLHHGQTGIHYAANISDFLVTGTRITNNHIVNPYYRGIVLYDHDSPVVSGNIIEAPSTYLAFRGMAIHDCDYGMRIDRNVMLIQRGYGLYIYGCDGTFSTSGLIANNVISLGGTSTAYGIYLYSSDYQRLYHNTVQISSTDARYGRVLYISEGVEVGMRNNIFANSGGGYIYYIKTPATIATSGYNDLFTTGACLANWDDIDYVDLDTLKVVSGMESKSISALPLFVSESAQDYHLQEYSPAIGAGSPAGEASVDTADIEDSARPNPAGSSPDLGAYEHVRATPVDVSLTIPTGLTAEAGDGKVTLSWVPNLEPTLAYYVVYQDSISGFIPAAEDSAARVNAPDTAVVLTGLVNGTTYYFRVEAVDVLGQRSGYSEDVAAMPSALYVDPGQSLPAVFALYQNYPNPFNPATTIRFDLPQAGEVALVVYDLLGNEVIRLVNSNLPSSYHQVVWNSRTGEGREIPSGIYIARLVTQDYSKSIKMVLVK